MPARTGQERGKTSQAKLPSSLLLITSTMVDGEMTQQLGVLTTYRDSWVGFLLPTLRGLQLPIIPVPGIQHPLLASKGSCIHEVHINLMLAPTHDN